MRVACFLISRLSRASSIGSQVLFYRQQVGRGSVAYLAPQMIGRRLVAVVGKSIPGHLLKDVGLPEFSWSPELGVCFQHLWKRARCSVSVVSRLWLGLGAGSRRSVLVLGSIWGY